MMDNIHKFKVFDHLIPDLNQWPITKFVLRKKTFLQGLNADVFEQFQRMSKEDIDQAIARTIYLEKQRVKTNPWKADPPNEMQYYRKIQNEYNANQLLTDKHKGNLETLSRLINRFSQEIIGHFNPKTFLFVRRWSDMLFNTLLFQFRWSIFWSKSEKLRAQNQQALRVNGYVESVRNLFNDHIVVLMPTHSSNLDSILVGYGIDLCVGLPAFTYGAGLNLFDSEFFAFFMNRLGAYKVDRRKKNSIYLHALTSYSKLSIKEGVNTIFFPGGTRSRSGELELKLKLGLLGSLIQAQRLLIEAGSPKKIAVVPLIIGYESVLEARSLIAQYLSSTGQEKYTARSIKPGVSSYFTFIRRVMKYKTDIYLTFGKPMDVFGNSMDDNGVSYNHKNQQVSLMDYYMSQGQLVKDDQREMIYTRELGENIAEAFKKYHYVLPAHLVAHAAFVLLSKMNPQHDIYSIVQLPEEDYYLPENAMISLCTQFQHLIFQKAEAGKLIYPAQLEGNVGDVMAKGIEQLGIFHIQRILKKDQYGRFYSEDFLGLLFYGNRLNHMELVAEVDWSSIHWESDRF